MKKLSAFCVLLLVGMSCVGLAIYSRSTAGAAQAQPSDKAQVELITITPDGFYPSEISRAKGTFLLAIDDRSGLAGTDLSFERIVGNNQKEKVVGRNVKRSEPFWAEEQKLTPGDYVLTEANHPNWKCSITITAK